MDLYRLPDSYFVVSEGASGPIEGWRTRIVQLMLDAKRKDGLMASGDRTAKQ